MTTLGGTMFGYCATGRTKSARLPTSTITIDSTAAKIGRSMKKWENFITVQQAPAKLLLIDRGRVGGLRHGNGYAGGSHRRAGAHHHQAIHDDPFLGLD